MKFYDFLRESRTLPKRIIEIERKVGTEVRGSLLYNLINLDCAISRKSITFQIRVALIEEVSEETFKEFHCLAPGYQKVIK